MIKSIFNSIVNVLEYIIKYVKITYEEINVIVWYYIIPITWLLLLNLDLVIIYTTLWLGIIIGCDSFTSYCNKTFSKSVRFLLYFKKYGISYEFSSIIFCLIIPIIIYSILINL